MFEKDKQHQCEEREMVHLWTQFVYFPCSHIIYAPLSTRHYQKISFILFLLFPLSRLLCFISNKKKKACALFLSMMQLKLCSHSVYMKRHLMANKNEMTSKQNKVKNLNCDNLPLRLLFRCSTTIRYIYFCVVTFFIHVNIVIALWFVVFQCVQTSEFVCIF